MELFPYDIQKCPITLASWVYDSSQLQLLPKHDVAILGTSHWDVSKNWIIQNFTGKRSVVNYEEPIGTVTYDQMDFSISLKRKSGFYVLTLLVPCYLISIIACLCYTIPPQDSDRISLLLTTFLAIMVFVLVVLEIVPEESDTVPLFSKFLLKVILLNMGHIFYCTFVCGLHSMDQICIGPPGCLVTWAKCMTSCMKPSDYHLSSNRSKKVILQQGSPRMLAKSASTPQLNKGNIQGNLENQIDIRTNSSKGDTDHVPDIPPKSNDIDDKNAIGEQHIKEWRMVFKAMDILLFIVIFLGLTGYFLGILVIYS